MLSVAPMTPPSTPFHLPSLDGIRAASIAIVFVAHAGWGDKVPGGLGVTIFFFLSGFLITSLLRREFARSGTINIPHFYIRRAFRILPPFYLALGLAGALAVFGLLPGSVSAEGMALLALHIGNYAQIFWPEFAIPQGAGVFWSLAVEEHYYLTFPFLALSLLKKSRRTVFFVLGTVALLTLAWRVVLVSGGAPSIRTNYGSDTRVDSILWGAILAFCMNPRLDPVPPVLARARGLLVSLGGALLLFSLFYRDEAFRETYRYTLQGIALLPLFYFAVKDPEFWPFAWLNNKAMRYVGALSYTLYLVHHVAIYAVHHALPGVHLMGQAALSLAISFALAALSYQYLEKPLAKLRHRYN